ncbi:hypothetical protein Smp_153730 [Schistosoma mansoni]|uniref:hypothetical protein n=1 Tax=Schistosoma mansoni TaxID=6183 RepID=UPI0001A63DC6|nr:hypothetical protein Smp_153730 [Schistosoma mansoni]|eukprot:XP_018645847.1 hypothetical protein Smp_153730 [Schistosoma mansoni]
MNDDKRIVPWVDASEFSDVANNICSCETYKLRLAWETIKIWLCRMPVSKIPRSIVCTYELLNAYFENSSQSMALALMRFVSLLSSESQDRERPNFALPILSLARVAGLPSWLADLRNDIAHGIIPSTDTLESAFWWSLKYLSEFWASNVNYNEERIFELDGFLKCQSLTLTKYIESLLQGDKTSQLDMKEVFSSRSTYACFPLIINAICSYGCNLFTGESPLCNIVQNQAIKLKPLFSTMLYHKLVGELVLQFILGLRNDRSVDDDIRLEWCIAWIEAIRCRVSGKSILCDYVDGLSLDWRKALDHILNHMCDKYRDLFMKLLIIRDPPIPQDKLKVIMSHVDVFCGRDVPNTHELRKQVLCEPGWKLADSLLWAETPLGAIINSCKNNFF